MLTASRSFVRDGRYNEGWRTQETILY